MMTKEEIRRIVDDKRTEQLTIQLCRHWEVASQRLQGLVEELTAGLDTCIEAELYAAMMRKSQHNNQFTARFFCHLVGEMKKSAVFGTHSDADLAKKLVAARSVDTFRKNIQEGMGGEDKKLQKAFQTIYQKYNHLAHPHQSLHL